MTDLLFKKHQKAPWMDLWAVQATVHSITDWRYCRIFCGGYLNVNDLRLCVHNFLWLFASSRTFRWKSCSDTRPLRNKFSTSITMSPQVQFPSTGVPFGVRMRARTIINFQHSFGPSDPVKGPLWGYGKFKGYTEHAHTQTSHKCHLKCKHIYIYILS